MNNVGQGHIMIYCTGVKDRYDMDIINIQTNDPVYTEIINLQYQASNPPESSILAVFGQNKKKYSV